MIQLLPLLFLFTGIAAQNMGIRFTTGTWQSVFDKAGKENKLVFVDVYTSWCGPCKRMAAEVFTRKEVGERFNTQFVNYQMDAEKGEAVAIAKKYRVNAYPTYLFLNSKGELVYRLTGYMESSLFLSQADIALQEANDPKPIAQWMKEYESGKRDKSFMDGYMAKRKLLKMPSADIVDEVLPAYSTEELLAGKLSLFFYYDSNISFVPGGNLFRFIMDHSSAADSLLGKSKNYSLRLLAQGMQHYFRNNIIAQSKDDMFSPALDAFRKIDSLLDPKMVTLNQLRYRMDFYRDTHQKAETIEAAKAFVENGLLQQDIASIQQMDQQELAGFMEPFLKGTKDSVTTTDWLLRKRMAGHAKIVNLSYALRDAAQAVYEQAETGKDLEMALKWIRLAGEWFPHFSSKAVEAGLLLKLNKKQQAVDCMKEAMLDPVLKNNPSVESILSDNLKQIDKGQAPQHLWSASR